MLYSQILNPYPDFTEEKAKKAADLLNDVLEGRKPSYSLSLYDSAVLQAAKEVIERVLKYEFGSDFDDNEYWESEYLKVLYRWLETIAFYDADGMWFLKDVTECSFEDFDLEYYRDEFAMMHFDMNVRIMLNLRLGKN
ncbi:hypothetical protein [Runella sp. SP2]|uniref:hypothetical protein n=1 Tax=Runella sp. SP2 TaxID=2268026 RepID=UPI000F08CEED|nr:hypothetical protein [Runella sp. SP2]AYQ35506.1 hypothetical protein DTQ70_26550 [Runella sp. SP2]